MLIRCAECELQVSDKAIYCPHCGYPQQPNAKPRKPRQSNKRRRLPNGFGQISEIKNRNLRNPFRAMVTVGKTPEGRPICKPLKPESYFPSYNDAYAALVEYNKNPYELSPSITVKELYEKWSVEHFKSYKAKGSSKTVETAWKYCSSIYDMRVIDLRVRHIKGCLEKGVLVVRGEEQLPNANTKNKIKSLFNVMLDYALEYELVDRNYARSFSLSSEVKKEITTVKKKHIPFNDREMRLLWEHVDKIKYIDVILVQCYSGWRPQELELIRVDNVDLKNWVFTGGLKTDAGENRTIPIHSRVKHLVERNYKEAKELGSDYLFNYIDQNRYDKSTRLTYTRFVRTFTKICEELKLDPGHRPHDGRKHFVTAAKKYKVDEYAIKYLVGHTISDITEKIYTERDINWLKEEIEKIK